MESKIELYKAIANVMKDVKNIDKSMTVGTGNNAYKGVSDKDVKLKIGAAMENHGLIMVPKNYHNEVTIERWMEKTNYGEKQKQSVFVECNAQFELIHVETGQSIDIPAYGHGVDSQDKAAGKATTYALKYALLYTFLVPTGSIDDSDNTNSAEIPTPKTPAPTPKTPAPKQLPKVDFVMAVDAIKKGKTTVDKILKVRTVTPEELKALREVETETNKTK
jgi:hypothetical protein